MGSGSYLRSRLLHPDTNKGTTMKYLLAALVVAVACAASVTHAHQTAGSMAGASAGASAYNGGNTNNFLGSEPPLIAPTVFAPGLTGGSNPRTVSWSASVSVPMGGAAAGSASEGTKCDRRNWFILAVSAWKASGNVQFLNMAIALANQANAEMDIPVALQYYAANASVPPVPQAPATGPAVQAPKRPALCEGVRFAEERRVYADLCGFDVPHRQKNKKK